MYFLTAIRQEQSGMKNLTQAALLSALRGKDRLQIVLACVGESAVTARLTELWKEDSARWCRRGDAQAVLGRAERALRRAVRGYEGSLALLCCADSLCFYAWQGDADIRLLNTSFGKSSVRTLTRASEQMTWEWAQLEPQVGILLGTGAFFDAAGKRDLTDALAIRSLCSQIQAERHLAELPEAPAALVVTKAGLLLGSGAFGCVYRTEYEGRTAACKEARTADGIGLLRREAQLMRGLRHPLFPHYYGFAERDGTARLFMEEIRGSTLADELRRNGRLPEREARRLAAELAEGLLYLHRLPEPVVYRDLKPENIILSHSKLRQHARLLDLGCACAVSRSAQSRAGTPGYAAPEQLTGDRGTVTCACDVYALGVVLDRMTGGAADGELAGLIAACRRKEPERRPAMGEVLRGLKAQ